MARFIKVIDIYILIIVMISIEVLAANKKSFVKTIEVKSDFPEHKDLDGYLNSLERIVLFFSLNKNYLNLNTLFGLFLVNVNLRPFVKNHDLPAYVRTHLKYILTQTDELLKLHYDDDWTKISTALFSNDTAWAQRISNLNINSPKNIYSYRFPKWSKYLRAVDDFEMGIPNPQLSGLCLRSLAESEENLSKYPLRCELPDDCYTALKFGTNYGYGLTHRLLLLLEARLSRGCSIFSPREDKQITHSLCAKAYNEAEYNANNGFVNVDLIFEQIAVCTLDGHAKFLRKSWLSNLLQFQTPWGCFDITYSVPSKQQFLDLTSPPDADQCNGHVTSVAAATLAQAIRFILENY